MSSPVAVPTPSQLDGTFGCLYLAVVFGSVLWGIGCLQLYLYYEKYWKTDQHWLKVYVFVIWAFDAVHHILLLVWMYQNFVRGIGNPTLLALFPRTAIHTGIFASLVDVMAQIIFVRRAWYLSRRNFVITGILSVLVLGQFTFNTYYWGRILNVTLLAELSRFLQLNQALNATIACVETILAATLVCLLWRSRSGFKRTDSILHRLVVYTIGSGSVTAVMMIIAVISASLAPDSLVYGLADLVLPRLYLNCVLSSLNARSSLRENIMSNGGGVSYRFDDLSSNAGPRANINVSTDLQNKAAPRVIECRVDVDVDSGSDQRKIGGRFDESENDSMTGPPKAV